ncbi:MAG TPA: hypothetical protein VGG22_07865 [Candidatus Baltobacteraceae bacterium]
MIERRPRNQLENAAVSRGMLWKGPAEFHGRMSAIAKDLKLTQSEYLTSAMVLLSIVLAKSKPSKQKLLDLIGEMNSAISDDQNILCTCRDSEWEQLKQFVGDLQEAGIVEGLRTTASPGSAKATAYTFRFTEDGRAVWNAIGKPLRDLVSAQAFR